MFGTTGNTPFELAEQRRIQANKTLSLALATDEVVKLLNECDIILKTYWSIRDLYNDEPSEDNRELLEEALLLATQARKDQKLGEAALATLLRSTDDVGFFE